MDLGLYIKHSDSQSEDTQKRQIAKVFFGYYKAFGGPGYHIESHQQSDEINQANQINKFL